MPVCGGRLVPTPVLLQCQACAYIRPVHISDCLPVACTSFQSLGFKKDYRLNLVIVQVLSQLDTKRDTYLGLYQVLAIGFQEENLSSFNTRLQPIEYQKEYLAHFLYQA
jgi:hypothetical protein